MPEQGKKGAGRGEELDWLKVDMVDKLKPCEHAGGAEGHMILKSDDVNAVQE